MTAHGRRGRKTIAGLIMIATIASVLTTLHQSNHGVPVLANAHAISHPTPASKALPKSQSTVARVSSNQLIEPTANQSPGALLKQGFVVDHHSVALFEEIPDNYIAAARDLRLLFSDRSVGQNINESLNCLTASSWASSPAYCRRDYYDANWHWKTYRVTDQSNGLVPVQILFDPDPAKYDRGNWTFEYRDGTWTELTQDFIQGLAPSNIDSKDVLSYQFGYLNADANSDIADPDIGFFADNPDRYDVYDLESYIAKHPDKIFIFWTISLARSIGSQPAADFNNQMRQYAVEHNKILFDMADIVAHTHQGDSCYDNRDGIQYCTSKGQCENYPDDGKNLPAICQDYTTETDGGHLGSVSGAKIRVAKALWVLMAGVAGWDGVGTWSPTSTPTPAKKDGD